MAGVFAIHPQWAPAGYGVAPTPWTAVQRAAWEAISKLAGAWRVSGPRSMADPNSGVPSIANATYEDRVVARATVRIHLEDRAREVVALAPSRPGAVSLHPSARGILEQAESDPGGSPFRIVRCTVHEARALLDYFSRATDALKALRDPDADVCAAARDSVRWAIVAAGV